MRRRDPVRGFVSGMALLGLLGACGRDATHRVNQPVFYGDDDRMDYYEETDVRWRDLAYRSSVVVVSRDFVNTTDPSDVRIEYDTLGVYAELCPGQRFADQVAAGECSGTLIDDDLVLTAGHCFVTRSDCTDYRLVFRYAMVDESTLSTITTDDVFRCRQVLVRQVDDEGSDHAIVRLDRRATPRHEPAVVQKTLAPIRAGSRVISISFPDGIPVKIDANGIVYDNGAPDFKFFTAGMDVFAGSSGSGVYDTNAVLVGIEVRGEDDYHREGSCYVVSQLAYDGSEGYEEVSYVANAVAALCRTGYPSVRLCDALPDGGAVGDGGVPEDAGVTADAGAPPGGGADGGGPPPPVQSSSGCAAATGRDAGAWVSVLALGALAMARRRRRT